MSIVAELEALAPHVLFDPSHAIDYEAVGAALRRFEGLAIEALSELWADAVSPLLLLLYRMLAANGEAVMLTGLTFVRISALVSALKAPSLAGRGVRMDFVCVFSYLGGAAYLAERHGDGFVWDPVFQLYLFNIFVTCCAIKVVLSRKLLERIRPCDGPAPARRRRLTSFRSRVKFQEEMARAIMSAPSHAALMGAPSSIAPTMATSAPWTLASSVRPPSRMSSTTDRSP